MSTRHQRQRQRQRQRVIPTMMLSSVVSWCLLFVGCHGFTFSAVRGVLPLPSACRSLHLHGNQNDGSGSGSAPPPKNDGERPTRRSFLTAGSVSVLFPFMLASPPVAFAGIDPLALKTLPVEGDTTGATTRLRQVEADKVRPTDALNIPFTELPSGVSYREFREGKGEAVVGPGSRVAVEMTVRCKAMATANEPGGLQYFSTKGDTEFNELAFTIGEGEILPGLEEAMMGMHKGAIRRIEVPSTQVYAARKANQLPLPNKQNNKEGQRRFDNLFKMDGTLLFEVLVTRIK